MRFSFYQRIYLPIVSYLRQGMSPIKLAQAFAIGFGLGILPFLGVTTVLCALLATVFRLNQAVIQFVNYGVYPLQIVLFIPFIRFGIYIFGGSPLPFSTDQLLEMAQRDGIGLAMKLGHLSLLGVGAWMLIVPFVVMLVYFISLQLFNRIRKEQTE